MSAEFDVEKDVDDLFEAFKGIGTDNKTVILIIANRTYQQRQLIRTRYQEKYNEDIQKRLQDELSGNFEDLAICLFDAAPVYDSRELYREGDDIAAFIEILAMRSPDKLKKIIEAYPTAPKSVGKSLEDRIKEVFKDATVQDIMLSLLKGERNPEDKTPSYEECKALGEEVAKLEKLTWEVNNPFYNAVMKLNSKELAMFCRYFHKAKGGDMNIVKAIETDFGKDTPAYKALYYLIFAVVSPSEYCAEHFHDSMEGIGTDDDKLIRLVISRREKDLPLIKKYYKQKYNKELIEEIKGESSGNYKRLLVDLCADKTEVS